MKTGEVSANPEKRRSQRAKKGSLAAELQDWLEGELGTGKIEVVEVPAGSSENAVYAFAAQAGGLSRDEIKDLVRRGVVDHTKVVRLPAAGLDASKAPEETSALQGDVGGLSSIRRLMLRLVAILSNDVADASVLYFIEQTDDAKRRLVEAEQELYNSSRMLQRAEYYAAANDACDRGLSVGELQEAIEQKLADKGKASSREITGREAAEPHPVRLKWETDRQPDENPAAFAWRAYQTEAAVGKLHQGLIYDENRELYRRLRSWLRSHPMPEDIDIPTKRDWITRQIEAGRAKPASVSRPRTEEQRLYEAVARRRQRAHSPV
jgi:hypothetical protein